MIIEGLILFFICTVIMFLYTLFCINGSKYSEHKITTIAEYILHYIDCFIIVTLIFVIVIGVGFLM